MADDEAIETIDDLLLQLDNDAKQEDYSAWKEQSKQYLTSQLKKYDSITAKIEKSLKGKFKVKTFLEQFQATKGWKKLHLLKILNEKIQAGGHLRRKFGKLRYLSLKAEGSVEAMTRNDNDISNLASYVSIIPFVRYDSFYFNKDKKDLEKSISDFKSQIKFDRLSDPDKERINNVFDENGDIDSLLYNYITKGLGDYNEKFEVFLKSLEELNQTAEELHKYSRIYPGRFARGLAKKDWKNGLPTLLESLEIKYEAAQSAYKSLSETRESKYRGGVIMPSSFEDIDRLKAIKEELVNMNPQPKEIKVERIDAGTEVDERTYLISIESTNEYGMDKPSLKLCGEYEIESGVTGKIDIDLTKEKKEKFFSNTVISGNDQGLVEKLEVKLTVNLPEERFKLKFLEVIGLYELPYFAATKPLEKSLTTENAQLI